MPPQTSPQPSSKKPLIFGLIAVLIIIAGVVGYISRSQSGGTASWTAYEQKDTGLSIKYPSGWHIFDSINPNSSCCVFILNYEESATTTFDGPGRVKMQMGYYRMPGFDPFKLGSTTQMKLGTNVVYKGTSAGTPFYIIPRSPTEGFGVAVFTQPSNATQAADIVEQILATASLPALPVSTSTAAAPSAAK